MIWLIARSLTRACLTRHVRAVTHAHACCVHTSVFRISGAYFMYDVAMKQSDEVSRTQLLAASHQVETLPVVLAAAAADDDCHHG